MDQRDLILRALASRAANVANTQPRRSLGGTTTGGGRMQGQNNTGGTGPVIPGRTMNQGQNKIIEDENYQTFGIPTGYALRPEFTWNDVFTGYDNFNTGKGGGISTQEFGRKLLDHFFYMPGQ